MMQHSSRYIEHVEYLLQRDCIELEDKPEPKVLGTRLVAAMMMRLAKNQVIIIEGAVLVRENSIFKTTYSK